MAATKEQIVKEVDSLFGNTTVPASQTRADLEYLREHIDSLIATLAADGVEALNEIDIPNPGGIEE